MLLRLFFLFVVGFAVGVACGEVRRHLPPPEKQHDTFSGSDASPYFNGKFVWHLKAAEE